MSARSSAAGESSAREPSRVDRPDGLAAVTRALVEESPRSASRESRDSVTTPRVPREAKRTASIPKSIPKSGQASIPRPIPTTGPARDPESATDSSEDAAARLERRIRAHLSKGALTVTLTDNRYTMISVRRDKKHGPHFRVRLHRMFAGADPVITRALARYIEKNDKDASSLLGDFIDTHQDEVRDRERRAARRRLTTAGRHHDLQDIFDDLNRRYFGGAIDARITWGQRAGKRRRRNSIKMGSYSVEDRLIRIHRSLDRAFVPRFFVEWIVYHEMLHQVHDIKVVNGRRCFHSKAFLADEALFEHYREARAWERANLDALLTF